MDVGTGDALRRFAVLSGIIAAGILSQGALWIGCGRPEQAAAAPPLTMEAVAENLYVIKGAGGNTVVLVTDPGIVLVDTKLPGNGAAILEKVRSVSDKPIETIINTHTHADHVGSNAFLAAADIVAHVNTRRHMVRYSEKTGVSEPHSTPTTTFRDQHVVSIGAQEIKLYYFGQGHTDGDIVVVFPAARVLHSGDLFVDTTLPVIDEIHGGSALKLAETLTTAYGRITGVDKVITGHGGVVDWKDFGTHAAFNRHLVEWGTRAWEAGTPEERAAAEYQLPQAFAHYAVPRWRLRQHLTTIFDELQQPATPPRRWWGGVP